MLLYPLKCEYKSWVYNLCGFRSWIKLSLWNFIHAIISSTVERWAGIEESIVNKTLWEDPFVLYIFIARLFLKRLLCNPVYSNNINAYLISTVVRFTLHKAMQCIECNLRYLVDNLLCFQLSNLSSLGPIPALYVPGCIKVLLSKETNKICFLMKCILLFLSSAMDLQNNVGYRQI